MQNLISISPLWLCFTATIQVWWCLDEQHHTLRCWFIRLTIFCHPRQNSCSFLTAGYSVPTRSNADTLSALCAEFPQHGSFQPGSAFGIHRDTARRTTYHSLESTTLGCFFYTLYATSPNIR